MFCLAVDAPLGRGQRRLSGRLDRVVTVDADVFAFLGQFGLDAGDFVVTLAVHHFGGRFNHALGNSHGRALPRALRLARLPFDFSGAMGGVGRLLRSTHALEEADLPERREGNSAETAGAANS